MTGDIKDFKSRCVSFESQHIVGYYAGNDLLLESLWYFLEPGSNDQQFIIIARPTTILKLRKLLGESAHPLIRLSDGNYHVFSSVSTLDEIMANNTLARKLFFAKLEPIIAALPKSQKPIKVYSDMSASLWENGDEAAALKLEEFWDDLSNKQNFVLYCSYHIQLASKDKSKPNLIDARHDLSFIFDA